MRLNKVFPKKTEEKITTQSTANSSDSPLSVYFLHLRTFEKLQEVQPGWPSRVHRLAGFHRIKRRKAPEGVVRGGNEGKKAA